MKDDVATMFDGVAIVQDEVCGVKDDAWGVKDEPWGVKNDAFGVKDLAPRMFVEARVVTNETLTMFAEPQVVQEGVWMEFFRARIVTDAFLGRSVDAWSSRSGLDEGSRRVARATTPADELWRRVGLC